MQYWKNGADHPLHLTPGGSDTLDPTIYKSDLDLDLPLNEEWQTINSILNNSEDGSSNLEISFAEPDNIIGPPEETFNNNVDDNNNFATTTTTSSSLCPSDNSPSSKGKRKSRRGEADSCKSFYPSSPPLQLPNVGDISQELIRQKHCSRSQWPNFGNIPVCAEEESNIKDMNTILLPNKGPLELPLQGWAVVYGALCK